MKKFLILTFTWTIVFSCMAPAQAIFGLSTCEKVKKRIISEERIGKAYWTEYRDNVSKLKVGQKVGNAEFEKLADSLIAIFDSDIRVYQLANKSPECFSTVQAKFARDSLPKSQTNKSDWVSLKKFMSGSILQEKPLRQATFDYYANVYKKYYSLYAVK